MAFLSLGQVKAGDKVKAAEWGPREAVEQAAHRVEIHRLAQRTAARAPRRARRVVHFMGGVFDNGHGRE
ncbi:MAG: hypothetical protein ACQESR_09040 [Planctomycetota bacterium]